MAKKKKKNQKNKWTHHYRMVVLNDDTFEERFSLKLNRLNVFIVTIISAVLLIGLTTVLIAFTPIREYIPGYADVTTKKIALQLTKETDSLKQLVATNDEFYGRIKMLLNGDITADEYARIDSIAKVETTVEVPDLSPIKEDSLLREEVAQADRYSVIAGAKAKTNFVFFPPVKGTISGNYDTEIKHYAVDVVAASGTPIKAAADGTVVFASWSADTGYTILIEHAYGLITVYKHAGSLNKEQNDQVLAGEVIAGVGNTGELTTGPHLHFEIWSDGYPLDPTNFINFE
ncbi:peptidase M23-like protein [Nonlabens dokdonensis]|jgi:murein DD-endopeptidase MepM/ murein hydrolase activator NlpD|uniref:Membrane peptidase, M23 family n=2 Tax=Nonlabens dokdonensis TaxID=328515 RepID=L7W8T3_NONDD|nr:M23 family metallopeptidase [Nonlabens dokdonensis]AGC76564.1 membrane peptidase, M23 family [Nonlabens dokdonensis DSW-6]PZX44215.1 peptidase M23-like protein [Nonlabens dokdonensis]